MTKQFRQFSTILYLDSTEYDCEDLLREFMFCCTNCCYILHDKDVYLEDIVDSDGLLVHSKGELKKPHYHVVFSINGTSSKSSANTIKFVADKFGLPDNMIEVVKSWAGSIRYLTHFDHPDKYQYDQSSIVTNFEIDSFFKSEIAECDCFLAICAFISDYHVSSAFALNNFISEHKKLYPAFRRNQNYLLSLIRENKNYTRQYTESKAVQEALVDKFFIPAPNIDFDND